MLGESTLRMVSFAEFCYGVANSKHWIQAILAIYLPMFWGCSFCRRTSPLSIPQRMNALWSHKIWQTQIVFIWKSWNMSTLFCFEISTTVYFFCPQMKQTKNPTSSKHCSLHCQLWKFQWILDQGLWQKNNKQKKPKPPALYKKKRD